MERITLLFLLALGVVMVAGERDEPAVSWPKRKGDPLSAQAWRTTETNGYPPAQYPESAVLSDRPNTAIAFSGGGSRSFVASMGELAALTKLGLMDKVRYVAGVSGGSWATLTYSFAQTNDDAVLLGDVPAPENLTRDNLKEMDEGCARGFASFDVVGHTLRWMETGRVKNMGEAWADAVSSAYLEPAGITRDTLFSFSEESVAAIKARNPSLAEEKFLLPSNAGRPYPIVSTTLVGPEEFSPYRTSNHNYSYIEVTPLYIGQMNERDVSYTSTKKTKLRHQSGTERVGGAVESFAVGAQGSAPKQGIAKGQASALLEVPAPSAKFDLRYAAGASGYAPGTFVESSYLEKLEDTSLFMSYWSPTLDEPESVQNLWADGGSTDNYLLMGLLQRRVDSIVLFANSHTPLQPSSSWDVTTDEYVKASMSDELGFYFGMEPSDYGKAERVMDYSDDQVFSQEDWPSFVEGLQRSQAEGGGIVATTKLTTIRNDHWGIIAGHEVQLTVAYLGRSLNWEAALSPELQEVLVPSDAEAAADPSQTVDSGPFKHFPHYQTKGGMLNSEQANALADLTGYVVLEHADIFKTVLA